MSRIIAKIVNRTIEFVDSPPVYSGGKHVDDIQFQFDSEWESFKKTAVFYRDEDNQFMATLTGDICTIPHEVLTRDGKLYFGVFGESGDKVITSKLVVYTVDRGVLTDPTSSDDPTFWDKLLEIKNEILQAKDEAHDYANQAQQSAEKLDDYYYDGLYVQGETYSGIASNKGIKLHKVVGKTAQQTTKGYQLFDASKLSTKSEGGATVTNNGDGSFTVSGSGDITGSSFTDNYVFSHEDTIKLLKEGDLHCNYGAKTFPYLEIQIRNESKVYAKMGNSVVDTNKCTITAEALNDEKSYLRYVFYGDKDKAIVPNVLKPMLYQDGDGTWERFTGGEPSPNPEYKQEPQFVQIENFNTNGGNLFDASKLKTVSAGGATITNNNDGSFAIGGSGSATTTGYLSYNDLTHEETVQILKAGDLKADFGNTSYPYFIVSVFNEDYSISKSMNNILSKTGTITIEQTDLEDTTLKMRYGFYQTANTAIKGAVIKPMLYQDGDGTWYPFNTSNTPVSLSLMALPNGVADTWKDGTLTHNVASVTFDGSSDEGWVYVSSGNYAYIKIANGATIYDASAINILCDRLNALTSSTPITGSTDTIRYGSSSPNDNYVYIGLNDTITSLETLRTWLSQNPITVWYQVAIPNTEPLAIPTLQSFYPFTNVWTDNTLPTDIEWELLANSDNSLQVEDILKRVEALESKAIGG